MKRTTRLIIVALTLSLIFIGAKSALAVPLTCDATTGAPGAGECRITAAHNFTGTFEVDRTLHIFGGGRIDSTGGGITLNICVAPAPVFSTCDFILDTPTVVGGGQSEADDPSLPTAGSASNITINVSRDVLMQAGSAILADNTIDGGNPGNITITAGRNMTMCGQTAGQPGCGAPGGNPGALISAQKISGGTANGGDVTITVGDKTKATGAFYMEGGSTTYGAETGATIDTTSSTSKAGSITITSGGSYFTEPGSVVQSGGTQEITATRQGGKIFIVSDCGLTTEGRVTSKGPDFGADLVHLESCEVIVRGLVESTGKGHVPDAPNSCDNVNDGLVGEVFRLGKPAAATGCIEVWGNVITIDSFNINPATKLPWAGELNADIGNGGAAGTSWIDIFAFSKLTVTDGTGNDRLSDNFGHAYFSTYAVHANALDGSDANPSVVTALVKNGPLTASGLAFEASSTLTSDTGHPVQPILGGGQFVGNGSAGGTIDLEASGTVTLDDADINASGDFFGGSPCPSGSGACGNGGHIIVKAWGAGSNISWTAGSGDVRTDTSGSGVVGGDIILNACGSINTTTTDFHGETPATSTGGANCDATKPTIPVYNTKADGSGVAVVIFNQALWALCGKSGISGIKFNDLNGNHVRDGNPLEPGLGSWGITLWNTNQTIAVATTSTALDGSYNFPNVAPGTYVVCETLKPGWQQTAPVAGAGVVACLTGGLGYTVVVGGCCDGGTCTGQDIPGKDFGNIQLATKSGTKWNDVNGNHVRDVGDNGLDGWVIHLFGTAVDGSAVHKTFTTAGGGNYLFTVLPGTYTVCEQLQGGWTQTFPTSGANCVTPGDGDNPTPGPIGYAIVLAGGDNDTGNDFGNTQPTTVTCPEDPNRAALLTRTVDKSKGNLSGGGVPGNPKNYLLVQDAYNDAKASGQSEVIGMFANTNENLLLDGSKSLTITQCTVARVTGNNYSPVWNITSTGKLTIIGPDSVGGSIGWRVAGNGGHNLKSIRANGAKVDGVLIVSSNNSVSWNDVGGNGDGSATAAGIRVEGGTNTLKGGTVDLNNGDGVQLIGGNNTLSGSNILSNTGNGVYVTGSTNTVTSNGRINQNGKNGILVSGPGTGSTLSSNTSESGKGNTLSGINVTGNTNQLTDNKMNSNGVGFSISGTGNKLKSNNTSNNAGNEYTIGAGNTDQGNKKNGSSFLFGAAGGNFN